MRRWQGLIGAMAVVTLGAAACGGEDGADDGADDIVEDVAELGAAADGQPNTDVTVPVPDDACGLLSPASVEEVAEGPTTPAAAESAFGDEVGPSSRCTWSNADFLPPVELTVTGNPALFSYARALIEDTGGIEADEVTGLGDEAYVYHDEGFGTEVIARQGDIVVQVRATTAAREAVIALTSEALSSL